MLSIAITADGPSSLWQGDRRSLHDRGRGTFFSSNGSEAIDYSIACFKVFVLSTISALQSLRILGRSPRKTHSFWPRPLTPLRMLWLLMVYRFDWQLCMPQYWSFIRLSPVSYRLTLYLQDFTCILEVAWILSLKLSDCCQSPISQSTLACLVFKPQLWKLDSRCFNDSKCNAGL